MKGRAVDWKQMGVRLNIKLQFYTKAGILPPYQPGRHIDQTSCFNSQRYTTTPNKIPLKQGHININRVL